MTVWGVYVKKVLKANQYNKFVFWFDVIFLSVWTILTLVSFIIWGNISSLLVGVVISVILLIFTLHNYRKAYKE